MIIKIIFIVHFVEFISLTVSVCDFGLVKVKVVHMLQVDRKLIDSQIFWAV